MKEYLTIVCLVSNPYIFMKSFVLREKSFNFALKMCKTV